MRPGKAMRAKLLEEEGKKSCHSFSAPRSISSGIMAKVGFNPDPLCSSHPMASSPDRNNHREHEKHKGHDWRFVAAYVEDCCR